MTPRLRLLAPLGLAILAILALLVAGTRHIVVRTASADTPNQTPSSRAAPWPDRVRGSSHQQRAGAQRRRLGDLGLCWGAPHGHRAGRGNAAVLAAGAFGATPGDVERVAHLVRAAPGGRPLRVCVTDEAGQFSLAGSTASPPGLLATGLPAGPEVLIGPTRRWRSRCSAPCPRHSPGHRCGGPAGSGPGRSGCWLIALLATFGLAVFAVVSAANDDDGPSTRRARTSAHAGRPTRMSRPADDLSEAGQDRPQPVS